MLDFANAIKVIDSSSAAQSSFTYTTPADGAVFGRLYNSAAANTSLKANGKEVYYYGSTNAANENFQIRDVKRGTVFTAGSALAAGTSGVFFTFVPYVQE